MNEKTIATIPLRDEGLVSLQATMQEAADWIRFAAARGADLAVLPETINLLHCKDAAVPLADLALENWQQSMAPLCEAAAQARIALILPLLVRERATLANRFYVLGKDGSVLGFYQKRVPAPGEQAAGVEPGKTDPILWEGLRLGGAICIDIFFPDVVLDPQLETGADLFVIPSLTPAGNVLDSSAVVCGVPFALAYSPWSRILDRDGSQLAAGGYRAETLRFGFGTPVQMAKVNFNAVSLFADYNQAKLHDVERHYGAKLRVRFNQENCIFTLESRSADLSVHEVMREFGLVSRREYFANYYPGLRKAQ